MENLTSETFREKVYDYTLEAEFTFNGSKPAVVDFYADWCSPCKTIAPILEELSTEITGADFYKVDVEEENELAARFGIRAVPTILFIPMIGSPTRMSGVVSKDKFKALIKEHLGVE